MIVVIDGPAGSGKSSTAKAVAKRLNIQYLDSGALYRALTFSFLQQQSNQDLFIESLRNTEILFKYENEVFRVWLNGNEITSEIRSMEVSRNVSDVACIVRVRAFVNALMHEAVKHSIYIAEGRDLGTAVFPDAEMKFFMIASVEQRARRRYKELKREGKDVTLDEITANIEQRDALDSGRDADPLKQAEGAILIDTTELTFEEQVEVICNRIKESIQF